MKNKDFTQILQGIVAVVVGILIAVLGIGAVMDTYLGILITVSGGVGLLFAFYVLATKKMLPLGILTLSSAFIAIGVGVFTNYISFLVLINILVFALFGVGGAMIIYGVYAITKGKTPFGVAFIVIGAGLIALAACYLAIPDFQKVFWIIAGILIAAYGVLTIVLALTDKSRR